MAKTTLIILLITMLAVVIITGCSASDGESNENVVTTEVVTDALTTEEPTTETVEVEKIKIIASLFPHYDFAKRIAGEYAEVSLILPPGIESHSFEPTPREIISIMDSKIFLYTNDLMEPWAAELIKNVDKSSTIVVDLSASIELLKFDEDHSHGHDHEDSEDDNHEGEYDPHYWLDLGNAMLMVASIKDALIEAMPEQRNTFEANAEALYEELKALDESFFDMMNHVSSKTILSGGHFAFGYFASRYGLDHKSPYNGFSPDAEPTPKNIAALIKSVKETGVKAIFYEELIEPRVAKIISEEAKVDMLLLHGAHNISKDELSSNISYVDIMKGNLERLKIGLGYNE